jgi:hypothetical protein
MGYYESTRGSTILRAKTPMYLIRPVNSSDSVLALSHGKGMRTKLKDSDDISVLSSSSSLQSSTSVERKKTRKSDVRIQVRD